MLVAPSDHDPSRTYPLVFAWYHISGNAMDFVDDIDVQALADERQMLIVVPQDSGMFEATWPMTPLDNAQAHVDLVFFDDLLSCISEQFSVNASCVASAGVSAGGLWTSFLGQRRGEWLSSNLVFSGGYPTEFGQFWWGWQKSPHTFASMVLWGGPSDQLAIDFPRGVARLQKPPRGRRPLHRVLPAHQRPRCAPARARRDRTADRRPVRLRPRPPLLVRGHLALRDRRAPPRSYCALP